MTSEAPLIEPILPPGMVAFESTSAAADAALLPDEAAALGNVCESRRRDYTAGRSCARRALAALGFPPAPILSGASREPLWPEGTVGSITHCTGYCVAVAASAHCFLSAGVDAEPHSPLPSGILPMIAREEERERLSRLPSGGVCWDKLLFSIKESIYKAWFPMTRQWLGFEDATVTVDPARRTFHAKVLLAGDGPGLPHPDAFEGRWVATESHLVTLVTVKATCDGVKTVVHP